MPKLESCNKNQLELMDFPHGHGGTRSGSGRKPTGKTIVIRIPVEILNIVTGIKKAHVAGKRFYLEVRQ